MVSNASDDGTFSGYDIKLFNHFNSLNLPVVILGGASSYSNLIEMIDLGLDVDGSSICVYYRKNNAV